MVNKLQKNVSKKVKLYSTMVLSSLATKGVSQIVYTDINDTSLVNHGDFFDIDLNNDGTNEIKLTITKNTFSNTSSVLMTFTYNKLRRVLADGLNGGDIVVTSYSSGSYQGYAEAFNQSNKIGSSASSWATNKANLVNLEVGSGNSFPRASFTYGEFDNVKDKYLGIRFKISGSTHYGWIRLDVTSGVDSVIIKDFAYEQTAGTSINAGDTGGTTVGIEEVFLAQTDFYASNGRIQLSGKVSNESELRIFSLDGKLIQRSLLNDAAQAVSLNEKFNGVYVVELKNKEGVLRKKLWLENRR